MAGKSALRQVFKRFSNLRLAGNIQGATLVQGRKQYGTNTDEKEYAFEMACSNIRYGEGVTQEIGMDCKNLGGRNICVMTDSSLVKLPPVQVVCDALEKAGLKYSVYDKCRVEPSDESFKAAIDFATKGEFDVFVAVGGGSVMDTCKAANLYSSNPKAEFLDYVNAPIGKGLPVTHKLKPLIAVTTTAGTGSETTGTAVFDLKHMKAKTGISNREIRPTLGIVDPLHLRSMPERVAAYSGIDVLCHAIESYTALPYYDRAPRPTNPNMRPAYQGYNPVSDIWSQHALEITNKYIRRAVYDASDDEARSVMHLASCYAGIGFGNAGCHLCHAMSYPISGLVREFMSKGYDDDHPMVPHGLSVIVTAPAVFEFTASACPERHLQAASFLGVDITNKKKEDAGPILGDRLRLIMQDLEVPDGLTSLGYTKDDIPYLVKGTMPQGCRDEEPEIPPDEDPCASVRCVQGWCEAYYNSTTCVCYDGFWGYLCEHEGSAHSSVFWDFLPLQEEAFLTGRINSEEEAVHPLCQVGSFPGPQHKRRALRNTNQAKNGKRRWTDAQEFGEESMIIGNIQTS